MIYTRIEAASAFHTEINDLINKDSHILMQTNYDIVYDCKISAVKIAKIKKLYEAVVDSWSA